MSFGKYADTHVKINLEQFFDSIRTYPGLGEAYMLQLTNQLIALGYASPGWSYAVGEHHIYGSSRLGIHQTKKELRNRYKQEEISIPSNTVNTTALYRGKRNYELSNHLGNVQVVITDKRKSVCDEELGVEYFVAEVLSAVDYYPFGKLLPDRQWYASYDTSQFVYGFNGMRYDHEINQKGRSVDYGARILDVDLGRWLSLDPLMAKYPALSPYVFVANNPIYFLDPDGKKILIYYIGENGEPKSYEYGSGLAVPDNKFVQETIYAIEYVSQSKTAKREIDKAVNSSLTLGIHELVDEREKMAGPNVLIVVEDESFPGGLLRNEDGSITNAGVLSWSPYTKSEIVYNNGAGTGKTQSASLMLVHEIIHWNNAVSNIKSSLRRIIKLDKKYDNKEERKTIKKEKQIAKELGEDTRDNHKGKIHKADGSTDHEPVEPSERPEGGMMR